MSKPPTLQEQADFLWLLRKRCTMRDGTAARETWLRMEGRDVEMLEGLRARLERMAPFEADIRRIVTRGRG